MRLIIDTPWYFVPLCLLLGAAYSAALYFLNNKHLHPTDNFPKNTTRILATLRFLVVSILALLLLAPLAKRNITQKEKPIIIIAQDNTTSLNLCPDSALYRTHYAQQIATLINDLSKDYDVQCFTYGTTLLQAQNTTYNEHTTDISSALSQLSQRFANRNVGALILTGDGIFNQGTNPVTIANQILFPIYTIALGDTTIRKDATIANVKHNTIAYLGNQFPLEISVSAKRLKGNNPQLSITHNGRQIFAKTLNYNSDDTFLTETVLLDADKPDIQNYTITISPAPGEISLKNNTLTIPIEVIDGRQKIAILAAAPHPDISALRQAIETNQNYEVNASLAKDFKDDLKQYDLVILHQLPMKGDNTPIISTLQKEHIPTLFIIGTLTDLPRFNSLHSGLEIFAKIDRQNESAPLYNPSFANFTLTDDLWHKIEQFPPLLSPFGDYKLSPSAQALFTAKVGTISSGLPLIAFAQQQDIRAAFIAGEGLWKWRLYDYQSNNSHEAFDQLINKTITYTALRISKDRFHVTTQKVYPESAPVSISAELYNDNFEPINTPEATITLTKESEKPNTYNFNRSGNNYELNLGQLEPGNYHYDAATTYNGKKYTKSGNFLVQQLNLEELNLVADHSLMQTLAQNSTGEMLLPSQLDQLPQLIRKRDDIKNVLYSHTKYTELLNIPWLFILLILLIGTEWALRKYNGEI